MASRRARVRGDRGHFATQCVPLALASLPLDPRAAQGDRGGHIGATLRVSATRRRTLEVAAQCPASEGASLLHHAAYEACGNPRARTTFRDVAMFGSQFASMA